MLKKNKLYLLAKSIAYYKTIRFKKINKINFEVCLIVDAGLFDLKYYNKTYGFNFKSNTKGAFHYIHIGAALNYNPNEYFDTQYYTETYPDVLENKENPIVHFIAFGWKEGRNPSSIFNTTYYIDANSDVKAHGVNPLSHYVKYGKKEHRATMPNNQYDQWIKLYDTLNHEKISSINQRLKELKFKPLISILMPVYNADITFLKLAIQSVTEQLYINWELCIADDASTNKELKPLLKKYAEKDKRIKIVFREKNGHISEASNSALEIAKGAYITLLDQDDELRPHSLFVMVDELNRNKDLKLIYSDEDKIDEKGTRFNPHFKPEWSPDLLYGQNYISHLGLYDAKIIKEIGGFRKGFEGSQDFDLLLRFIERIDKAQIKRVPEVLYHWRAIKGSTALAEAEKGYALDAGIKALQEHLNRTKQNAKAKISYLKKQLYRVVRELPEKQPLVTLIIPTKDRTEMLDKCLQSILNKTTYKNYEIIVVDNNSEESKSLKYFKNITTKHKNISVLRYEKPFNFSAINNFAVKQAKGEIIGLVNNDIVVITETWLDEMVSHALRKDVGAVGAKLYYENDSIQHGGVVTGLGSVAGHIHKYYPGTSEGYFGRLYLTQNFSAVTAACLLMRKEIFNEVGGLNEVDLTVAFNDVDLCLKIREKDYFIVWTPYAEMYHLESVSRGNDSDPDKVERFQKEIKYMHNTWNTHRKQDPYFNPNFSLHIEDYILSFPPNK